MVGWGGGCLRLVGVRMRVHALRATGVAFAVKSSHRPHCLVAAECLWPCRDTKTTRTHQGIRIVKYYAWEAPFVERISALRDVEVDKVRARVCGRVWACVNVCAMKINRT